MNLLLLKEDSLLFDFILKICYTGNRLKKKNYKIERKILMKSKCRYKELCGNLAFCKRCKRYEKKRKDIDN